MQIISPAIPMDIELECGNCGQRQPFVVQAAQVLTIAQHRHFPLFMTATTITDLFYIIRKAKMNNGIHR